MAPSSLLPGWSNPDLFALALAGVLAVFVTAVRRHRHSPWIVGGAMVGVVGVLAAVSTQFDLVGWHGFMHGAPLLRLLDGGPLPPEDPLFAGQALRYPWIEHWLMAVLARGTGLNAHFLTIGIEVGLFGALLASAAWLASTVTRERDVLALSVLLAGFGVSVFHGGLAQGALLRAFPSLSMETRIIPVDKFASITGMPLGYVAMVLSAAAGLRIACRVDGTRAMTVLVGGCTMVAALIHPLSWVGILAFQGVVGLVLLCSRRREQVLRAAGLAAAVVIPSLLAFPYLREVGISQSSDGWTGLTSPESLLWAKAADLALFLAPLALVSYVCRDRLLGLLDDGNRALRVLMLAVAAMAAAYLAVRFPGRNEYKFLLFAVPAAAVILSIGLAELLERHRALAVALIALLLLPGGRALGARPWFAVTDPCRADGAYLRILDPAADELYRWVAANTPADAVFLAADLRIPPLARRSLYIPVDAPWMGRDGWGLGREQLLQWHIRQPDPVMHRRQQLATMVLDGNWGGQDPAAVVSAIRADVPGRPLFVHVRAPAALARLKATAGFELRFENAAGGILAVTG